VLLADSAVREGSLLSFDDAQASTLAEPHGDHDLRVVGGPGAGLVHRLSVESVEVGSGVGSGCSAGNWSRARSTVTRRSTEGISLARARRSVVLPELVDQAGMRFLRDRTARRKPASSMLIVPVPTGSSRNTLPSRAPPATDRGLGADPHDR
jgi:hypothetical protein